MATDSWTRAALDGLVRQPRCGYYEGGTICAEPTALAALALTVYGYEAAATEALDQLVAMQQHDGSVGVSVTETTPVWPTGLAVVAWQSCPAVSAAHAAQNPYQAPIDRALEHIFSSWGEALVSSQNLGHDVTLRAWPWVAGTHSWVEPTAIGLIALKLTGHGGHDRAREAVRLLVDRLLPDGGCNYGNTYVLGNTLRPHVQPTGMALEALADESDDDGRIAQSIDYLRSALSPRTTALSLSHALLGLAAHGVVLDADGWLEAAFVRSRSGGASPFKSAMLLLAAAPDRCPLSRAASVETAI